MVYVSVRCLSGHIICSSEYLMAPVQETEYHHESPLFDDRVYAIEDICQWQKPDTGINSLCCDVSGRSLIDLCDEEGRYDCGLQGRVFAGSGAL